MINCAGVEGQAMVQVMIPKDSPQAEKFNRSLPVH
jgi:hypothetical protein